MVKLHSIEKKLDQKSLLGRKILGRNDRTPKKPVGIFRECLETYFGNIYDSIQYFISYEILHKISYKHIHFYPELESHDKLDKSLHHLNNFDT